MHKDATLVLDALKRGLNNTPHIYTNTQTHKHTHTHIHTTSTHTHVLQDYAGLLEGEGIDAEETEGQEPNKLTFLLLGFQEISFFWCG